jgi:hypothetical protein
MTHRNNHPQTNAAVHTRTSVLLRAAIASTLSYLVVFVVLITVQPGAGFGYV